MVNNGLGDATGRTRTMTVEATENISAGDAVAIDQSEGDDRYPPAAQALDDSSPDVDQVAGVASQDIDNGDRGTIVLSGPVIANVADNVNAGERLNTSATAGQLASEDDGPALALSDEDGTDSAGSALGSNEAEVHL